MVEGVALCPPRRTLFDNLKERSQRSELVISENYRRLPVSRNRLRAFSGGTACRSDTSEKSASDRLNGIGSEVNRKNEPNVHAILILRRAADRNVCPIRDSTWR